MAKVVILGCDHSAGEALRFLGEMGMCLPSQVEFQPLPCGGALDVLHILHALEAGAERVLILSCFDGACRSLKGNTWAEKRVAAGQVLLKEAGWPDDRVTYRQVSPNMASDLGRWVADLVILEEAESAS
ncbi:MAG: hydrogenase iron-sulfur subunit [Anaerolineae bacterium]